MNRDLLPGVFLWVFCLVGIGVAARSSFQQCPEDAKSQMRRCTEPYLRESRRNGSLTAICRTLHEIPSCLQDILDLCQEKVTAYADLNNSTQKYKKTFMELCSVTHSAALSRLADAMLTLTATLTLVMLGLQ